MPGIVIDEGLTRYYPFGAGMAHILGYVSSVSDKDVKDDPLLEVPGFKIGKSGIEKYLEKALRGESGNLKLEVNAYGRIMKEIERVDGIPGKDVQLTIDSRLQQKAFELFGEESGAAVLLDVHTGEILAFVSAPSFDPNMMTQGLSTEDWNALLHNERNPLTDKAISGQYSPGSTFKMIVALAALEAGVIKPETRTYCAGKMFWATMPFTVGKKKDTGILTLLRRCSIPAIFSSMKRLRNWESKKLPIWRVVSVSVLKSTSVWKTRKPV